MILDGVLGIGVAQACANYDQTFLGCAERLKNRPDTTVFLAWKAKLKKHEERQALLASQEYRQMKRTIVKQQKQGPKSVRVQPTTPHMETARSRGLVKSAVRPMEPGGVFPLAPRVETQPSQPQVEKVAPLSERESSAAS
jgi:hypothetical protein